MNLGYDPLEALGPERRGALEERLREAGLSGEGLDCALYAIAHAVQGAGLAIDIEDDESLREDIKRFAPHYEAICGHANALRDLLSVWRPHAGLGGGIWRVFARAGRCHHVRQLAPRGYRRIAASAKQTHGMA